MSKEGFNEKQVKRHQSLKVDKTILTVLSAFLTFAGPTYVVYVLLRGMNINYFVSIISGMILFVAGVVLILNLIKDEGIA